MFHRFHRQGSSSSGQGSLTEIEFEKILDFVGIESILAPDEWLSRLENDQLNSNDLCLTFDDGLRSQYEVALPVLEKYNLKAFWFVCSAMLQGEVDWSEMYGYIGANHFVSMKEFYNVFFSKCKDEVTKKWEENEFEKYTKEMHSAFPFYSTSDLKYRYLRNNVLTAQELDQIMDKIIKEQSIDINQLKAKLWFREPELKDIYAKGHYIGMHSYNHPKNLLALSSTEQLDQYKSNYKHLKRLCHTEIVAMAHPLNSYNEATLKVLEQLGVKCGFRSNMSPPQGSSINANDLELAREDATNILGMFRRENAVV